MAPLNALLKSWRIYILKDKYVYNLFLPQLGLFYIFLYIHLLGSLTLPSIYMSSSLFVYFITYIMTS